MPKRSLKTGYVVFGTVLGEDGRKLSGLTVEAFDADLGSADRLGSARTDDTSRYEIRYSERDFRKTRRETGGAELFIRVRDRMGRVLLETQPIPDAPAEQRIDAIIPRAGERDDDGRYRIRGIVRSPDLPTLQGLSVHILEVSVFDESVVGSAPLPEQGAYDVVFLPTGRKTGDLPDLCVVVRDGKKEIARSKVRVDVPPGELQIDLELPKGVKPPRPEFDVVKDKLDALYGERLLAMDDKAFVDSLGYAATKTRWDARALAMVRLALSYERSNQVDGMIPAELFYALFRAGVPGTDGAPYRVALDSAEGIWTSAMAKGVIRRLTEKELLVARKRFIALAADSSLDTPSPSGGPTLDGLLSGVFGEDRDSKAGVAELLNRHASDGEAFWTAVGRRFGAERRDRLKEDAALADLTLGNLAVVGRLREAVPRGPLDLETLASRGFGQAKAWRDLIGGVDVPVAIEGKDSGARRRAYADLLAEQIRLQHPVTVIAHEVKEGILPMLPGLRRPVHAFLSEHRNAFRLGEQPFERYVADNGLRVADPVRTEIMKIERVYRLAPETRAMHALLKAGIHSAYQVAKYEPAAFVERFAAKMGGAAIAERVVAAARETQVSLINLAVSQRTERTMLRIGADRTPITGVSAIQQRMMASTASSVDMEGLFDELDFCACAHCRSILSPAAYLVSLLQLCEPPPPDTGTARRPGRWPIDEIEERRPDILERPLTCENTHVPVPHIDIVNETLEYFVGGTTPRLTLTGFAGFSTDPSASPQGILAEPQNIARTAYDQLATARFPLALPFNEPLSSLREYLGLAGMSLPQVMETFRADDGMGSAVSSGYDWQHILLEELGISQQEFTILTDGSITVPDLYGGAAVAELKNAKFFARRIGISYEELTAILQTRFVNPDVWVLPMAATLGVSIGTIKDFVGQPRSSQRDADFLAKLSSGLDASAYGESIPDWVRANAGSLLGLLTLHNTATTPDPCDFSTMEFRYGDITLNNSTVSDFEFVRLLRFIRIWRRLKWPAESADGEPRAWSIAEVDMALSALYPVDQLPLASSTTVNIQRFDQGCKTLLLRLGALQRLARLLDVSDVDEMKQLLACVAPMQGTGPGSLYRDLFLSAGVLREFPDFAVDRMGCPIRDDARTLESYKAAVQTAFKLTPTDYELIVADLGLTPTSTLATSVGTSGLSVAEVGYLRRHFRLDTLSKIHRRAWMARRLGLPIGELLAISRKTDLGLDADIGANDGVVPPNRVEGLIRWIQSIRDAGLTLNEALTVFWNDRSVQLERSIHDAASRLAVDLRRDLAQIEAAMIVKDDPTSAALAQLLTATLGAEKTDLFMSFIERRARTAVPYAHNDPRLHDDIMKIDAALVYDDLRKLLIYNGGVMSATVAAALSAGTSAAPTTQAFKDAVAALRVRSRGPLSGLGLPALEAAHDAFITSVQTDSARRRALLADAIDVLKPIRQLQALVVRLHPTLGMSEAWLRDLLTTQTILCSHSAATSSAATDCLALLESGIKGKFTRGTAERSDAGSGAIDYGSTGARNFPSFGSTSTTAIVGKWKGHLVIPPGGALNIVVVSDTPSAPTLKLDGTPVGLLGPSSTPSTATTPRTWRNSTPLAFEADTAVPFELEVSDVRGLVRLEWAIGGGSQSVIPAEAIFSDDQVNTFKSTLLRLNRAGVLQDRLGLETEEARALFGLTALRLSRQGSTTARPLLGMLPTASEAAPAGMAARVWELAAYQRVRRESGVSPSAMSALLQDPAGQVADAESRFRVESRWSDDDVDAVLTRLKKGASSTMTRSDLQTPTVLARVHDALVALRRIGAPVTTMLTAIGHSPLHASVSALYASMRARRSMNDWMTMVKPINDRLRAARRDALVAFALVKLSADTDRKHIDTADRLYEYLWLDVLMHPRVETSRIRQDIASVQQFIQRLIELPGTENPLIQIPEAMRERWPWMKRYRVWEANRKVFLYPENYMIPELRDDQSPIYRETMSDLLQGDITEERAAEAMIGYLRKLEEVSRLETSAIHVDTRGTAGDATDDVTHVIGRTSGANRKYFYRRREPTGWTPWESVKLDIEDDPVLPIRWKGRLFLFWIKILQEGDKPSTTRIDGTGFTPAEPKMVVKAMLCWSEYLGGKWGPTRTSSVDRAVTLGVSFTGPNGTAPFRRTDYRLWARRRDDALEVFVAPHDANRDVLTRTPDFVLFNSFSEPDTPRTAPAKKIYWSSFLELWRSVSISRSSAAPDAINALQLRYADGSRLNSTDDRHSILARKDSASGMVTIPRDDFTAEWHRFAPVIYQDSRHSFFISADPGSVRQVAGVAFIPLFTNVMTMTVPTAVKAVTEGDMPSRPEARSLLVEGKSFVAFGSMISGGDADEDGRN